MKRSHSPGRPPKYPWQDWMIGTWTIKLGRDFHTPPKKFRNYLYLVANDRGLKVQTRILGETIIFRFWVAADELDKPPFVEQTKSR